MYDYVFFFQAEDGIRDLAVTGVQTCALPICRTIKAIGQAARGKIEALLGARVFLELHAKVLPKWRRQLASLKRLGYAGRSEERRVGKEGRFRGCPYH